MSETRDIFKQLLIYSDFMVSNEVWPLEQDASESGSKWGGFEMNEKVKTSDIDRRIWDLKFKFTDGLDLLHKLTWETE